THAAPSRPTYCDTSSFDSFPPEASRRLSNSAIVCRYWCNVVAMLSLSFLKAHRLRTLKQLMQTRNESCSICYFGNGRSVSFVLEQPQDVPPLFVVRQRYWLLFWKHAYQCSSYEAAMSYMDLVAMDRLSKKSFPGLAMLWTICHKLLFWKW